MKYSKTAHLKDGKEILLRSAGEADGAAVLEVFNLTHAETDFLLTYPEENTMTAADESAFLKELEESAGETELLALVDGKVAGTAGISAVGGTVKQRHRAEFGIGIAQAFWGMGIGRALTEGCIECARAAGYEQLELDVVAENPRAVALYESLGFVEYGRNPRGFRKKDGTYQTLILMRLAL